MQYLILWKLKRMCDFTEVYKHASIKRIHLSGLIYVSVMRLQISAQQPQPAFALKVTTEFSSVRLTKKKGECMHL